jgi:hypothetical protein
LSGHRGITATIRDLRRLNVSWPTLRADAPAKRKAQRRKGFPHTPHTQPTTSSTDATAPDLFKRHTCTRIRTP